jgi:hypothetical protein
MNRSALVLIAALLAVPVPSLGQNEPRPVPSTGNANLDELARRDAEREAANRPAVDFYGSDPLTANPYAYRRWLKSMVAADLVELESVTAELVASLDRAAPGDLRAASRQSDRVAKLSHRIWNNLQLRQATRERPRRDPSTRPRDLAEARAGAAAARALVDAIAVNVLEELRGRLVDAGRRVQILERLESLQRIGYQLKVDIGGSK